MHLNIFLLILSQYTVSCVLSLQEAPQLSIYVNINHVTTEHTPDMAFLRWHDVVTWLAYLNELVKISPFLAEPKRSLISYTSNWLKCLGAILFVTTNRWIHRTHTQSAHTRIALKESTKEQHLKNSFNCMLVCKCVCPTNRISSKFFFFTFCIPPCKLTLPKLLAFSALIPLPAHFTYKPVWRKIGSGVERRGS